MAFVISKNYKKHGSISAAVGLLAVLVSPTPLAGGIGITLGLWAIADFLTRAKSERAAMIWLGIGGALALSSAMVEAAQPPKLYELVVSSQKCMSSRNQIQCDYKIGRSLFVQIVGVGLPEVAITTYQADDQGDYYASIGMLHGCVIVKPGEQTAPEQWTNLAFISPRNGKVYRDWRECAKTE